MKRRMSMAVALLFVLAAAALSSCGGEVYAEGSGPEYPAQPYAATVESGGPYPPATYVATTEPVYYQGRPTYWYRAAGITETAEAGARTAKSPPL